MTPGRWDTLSRRLAGSAAGYCIDQLVGEPPERLHPLPLYGRLMARMESQLYLDDHLAGVAYAACGVGTGVACGRLVPSTTMATFLACGGRALARAARTVDEALRRDDLTAARTAMRSLVGRDTEHLGKSELARAVVESVAENTVDAVIAPGLFAVIGGAPGAFGYRAANTLDALVGYRSARYERFGWASARIDDVMNFVPARLTALLVALVRPHRATAVVRSVRRDAPGHPSPNAGVAEAAFAAALGLRLGGTSSYLGVAETRPFLGDGRPADLSDIDRAVRLSRDVGSAGAFGAAIASLWLRRRGHTAVSGERSPR